MADAVDSKSTVLKGVRVRLPPSVQSYTALTSIRTTSLRWLFLAVVLSLLELYLLLRIGTEIGGWLTLWLVIASALLGYGLIRHAGQQVRRAFWESLAKGTTPAATLLSGLLVLTAGILLIVPGPLSELLAIVLLIPPARRIIANHLQSSIVRKLGSQPAANDHENTWATYVGDHTHVDPLAPFGTRSFSRSDVVDTEGVEVQQGLLLGEHTYQEGEKEPDVEDDERASGSVKDVSGRGP